MYFIPYHWKDGEIDALINKNLRNDCFEEPNNPSNNNVYRVGGLLLPFIGGVIIGGLFLPRPNFQPNPPPYPYQYGGYSPQQAYYSTPGYYAPTNYITK